MRDTKEYQEQPVVTSASGGVFRKLLASISTKIVLPYLLLTLVVAGVGAFIVARLVSGSLQERFNNQLLDAGRVVSESMVDYEIRRLEVLRTVVGTEGVPENLAVGNQAELAGRVPQIIANSNTDAVEILDSQGLEIYGWQRPPNQISSVGEERRGADFSKIEEVNWVLNGFSDELGEKRILLSDTPHGLMIFTIGPVYKDNEPVGAAMVGTYLEEMVQDLTEIAAARVTLYDPDGRVLETSLGSDQTGIGQIIQEAPDQYKHVISTLAEAPDRYPIVLDKAENEVPLKRVTVLGQEYSLAYGDWRLRSQSIGFFSVALPTNFIVNAAVTSRNILSLLFAIGTVSVFVVGFVIARRIIHPLNRLVRTSVAVAQGDLGQRTGIRRGDEIGSLAYSFDMMTERLERRNRQLIEQASKLETILSSTADGIIVFDQNGVLVTVNPAANRILADTSSDFLADILRELPNSASLEGEPRSQLHQALEEAKLQKPKRYKVGTQVFSTLVALMTTPDGQNLGAVVALRDVTREAESEQLKDSFITSISHDLRTPLTAIKGFSDLLMMTQDNLNEHQLKAIDTINRNVNNLTRHINQIIEITELQDGSLKLYKETLCFTDLVNEVAQAWREPIEAKNISFRLTAPQVCIKITADSKRLAWAIDNLLKNAYNYTFEGYVEVRLFQTESEARLDIIDTGIGIAVADQPYLFSRFFRASHQSTFSIDGVGLGLFITRSIIEMHDGQAWATSKLHEGSIFSLALPLFKPALENP